MAHNKTNIFLDDSLIISRLQRKELSYLKPGRLSFAFSPIDKIYLDPFIDELPIKIGLELSLLGSRIMHCRIERGFLFQDIENNLSQVDFTEAINTIARLNQRTPIFYQVALSLAMEEMFEATVSEETKELRCFVIEFSRIFHHWQVIKNILICLKCDDLIDLVTMAQNFMKTPHDLLGRIYTANSYPTNNLNLNNLKDTINILENLAREMDSLVSINPEIRQSLRKKAFVTTSLASSFGLTGIYLRANRQFYDIRKEHNALGYKTPPLTSYTDGGDAWARFILRIKEILASIAWIKKYSVIFNENTVSIRPLLEEHSFDSEKARKPVAFGEVEGPEGDTKISIFLVPVLEKLVFRIRTPAFFVAQAIPHFLLNSEINDLPLVLHSLGINANEIDK